MEYARQAQIRIPKFLSAGNAVYRSVMGVHSTGEVPYLQVPCFCWVMLYAYSPLTLLVNVRKSTRPAKNSVMTSWHGYLSGGRCKWFAYGPTDATAIQSSLASLKYNWFKLSSASLLRLSWKRGCLPVVMLYWNRFEFWHNFNWDTMNYYSLLDSMRWFSHRRRCVPPRAAPPPKNTARGPRPRGRLPNKMQHSFFYPGDFDLWHMTLAFELGQDFCRLHVTAKFHHSMFNRSEVIVLTNRRYWKHPPCCTMVRWWVITTPTTTSCFIKSDTTPKP